MVTAAAAADLLPITQTQLFGVLGAVGLVALGWVAVDQLVRRWRVARSRARVARHQRDQAAAAVPEGVKGVRIGRRNSTSAAADGPEWLWLDDVTVTRRPRHAAFDPDEVTVMLRQPAVQPGDPTQAYVVGTGTTYPRVVDPPPAKGRPA